MILDIKRLFTKDTTIGRFEYLKLTWGLLLFPLLVVQLAIILPPNHWWYCVIATIAIIMLFVYLIIYWFATYKRLKNIFDNTITSVILMFVFLVLGTIGMFRIILSILLFLIPGKKKSNIIVSNKLFCITFPLVLLLLVSLRTLGINRWISSVAMADTLQVKDRIVTNIFNKDFQRGDIIVHDTNKKGVVYIKRIVALPGEKVEIRTLKNGAKYIFINDKLLIEPYVKSVYDYSECSEQMNCKPIIVPENSYYVLGDNRGNSYDSRYYGVINKEAIKGKVSHVWFPLNRRKVFATPQYYFKKSTISMDCNNVSEYMENMQKTMKANWNPPEFDTVSIAVSGSEKDCLKISYFIQRKNKDAEPIFGQKKEML